MRRGLVLAAALAGSLYLALSAQHLGDYPVDGGPALNALLHGDLHAFASSRPAMGSLSLLLRVPFAAIAHVGASTDLSIYRWGAFPCVASVAVLGVWLAAIAESRGTRLPGQLAIVAVAIFNPFTQSALASGHPEELLTTSLAVGAVVAAAQDRGMLTIGLLGLALASKQWAVLAVLPVLAILHEHRLRTLAGSAAIAAIATLPAFVGSPGDFVANQLALVHAQFLEPHVYSWLFVFAPRAPLPLGEGLGPAGAQLPASLVGLLHPLIIGVSIVIAIQLGRVGRARMTADGIFAAIALVFLLRCTLDTETVPYYHAPLFATVLAWDVMRGERLPYRALGAAVVGYALFDRLTLNVISRSLASWLYVAVTLGAAVLLAGILRGTRQRVATGRATSPATAAVEGI